MAITTKGRVNIPKTPKEGFELAAKIYAKHQADGTASELRNLDGESWDVVGPTIATGMEHHVEAERLKSLMEEEYRLRDAVFKPIDSINRASSGYLKGKYAKNPKKLGAWGYEIDDTPPAKSAAKK
ncbi:MAG: hypothetical protein H7330_14610 [Hymenobacteraceae bacterium]|nr:hypothetical protein [Hymenobacteraceae bacterium]